MIPRLQAFYGGAQEAWWHMPVALLRSYVTMLPRLRAERALGAVSETMIGTGSMRKQDAERALREWRREAEGPRDWSEIPPKTEQEKQELYAASGFFDVEVVS